MVGSVDGLVEEIQQSKAYNRLKHVSFLGVLDSIITTKIANSRAFSRAEHSEGVLRLALSVGSLLQLGEIETATLAAAALLHDLAHTPLSHSLEYAFPPERRYSNHHLKLKEMLLSEKKHSIEIRKILDKNKVDPKFVYDVIDNKHELGYFFNSPFNLDTLDGITRVFWSMGGFAPYNLNTIINASIMLYLGETLSREDIIKELDLFWHSKDRFYNGLLGATEYGARERAFQEKARHEIEKLDETLFSLDDHQFLTRFPELLSVTLQDASDQDLPTKQKFVINRDVLSINKKNLSERYARKRFI